MNSYNSLPGEPLFAEEMLEKANDQANKLIEKAISMADELMERANIQAHALIEKANIEALELIEKANRNETKINLKANLSEKTLLKKAGAKEIDLLKTASVTEKKLIKEADKRVSIHTSDNEFNEEAKLLIEDAEKDAQKLVKDAVIQAKDLVEEADEEAKDLVEDAGYEAKDLIKIAASKAKELVKVAAVESKNLIGEASLQTKIMVREAALQAKDLIKEAAARYVDQKLKFINIAAHELRTPVTSISLNVQFAERQIAKGVPINEHFLTMIKAPLDRLTRLLVYLVDMSLLERKLLVLIPVKANLTKVVMECVDEFRREAPRCHLKFMNTGPDIELSMDPVRIHQVLSNIIENAVNYCGQGEIEVSLNTLNDRVRVEIEDHGPGLTKEQQKIIFGTFQRVPSDTTIQTSGLGLGLPLCREIIRLHHGRIGVKSSEGVGSTFFFELPLSNGPQEGKSLT